MKSIKTHRISAVAIMCGLALWCCNSRGPVGAPSQDVASVAADAVSPAASAAAAASSGAPMPDASSGIAGHMVAALGNAPARPPTFPCAKIFDARGNTLIATANCSGIWGQFRVPLSPGTYVVEFGGMVPNRQTVEVTEGRWTELGPKRPPRPVP